MSLDPRTPFSSHFTAAEMTLSQEAVREGIDNTPGDAEVANLKLLCTSLLEPARVATGPILISSGYRCSQLNALLHGASGSYHVLGLAADHHSPRLSVYELTRWWVESSGLPFDQVIYEFAAWVHVAAAKPGQAPRRQAIMCFPGMKKDDGSQLYLPWDPNAVDPATGLLKAKEPS